MVFFSFNRNFFVFVTFFVFVYFFLYFFFLYMDIVVTFNLCFEFVAQTKELPNAKNVLIGCVTIAAVKDDDDDEAEIEPPPVLLPTPPPPTGISFDGLVAPICCADAAPMKLKHEELLLLLLFLFPGTPIDADESSRKTSTPPFARHAQTMSCFCDNVA